MKRIALTDGTGRWFDAEKAECIKQATYWNGNNWISKVTGSQFAHETLYRTKGGKWVLNQWSDFSGTQDKYNEIDNDAAAVWLSSQELEPHCDCEAEYNALEIH